MKTKTSRTARGERAAKKDARGGVVVSSCEHPKGDDAARMLGGLATEFLAALKLADVELSLTLTTDRKIRAVNKSWRKKDKPTDVLSFPAATLPKLKGQPRPLGDVVISFDTARRRAKEDGRKLEDELARYLAHGLLHLLGHDHHTPKEAKAMAAAENRLLGRAGMVADAAYDA